MVQKENGSGRSRRAGKPASGSVVKMTTIVLPEDTNKFGNIFGGRVMEWIDKAAAVAALRHARTNVVTASVDSLDFHSPIVLGGIVHLLATVNFVHRSSMEVGVKVLSEDPLTGEQHHTCTAYVTLVGLDGRGRPAPVPPLRPETAEERRRFRDGEARWKQRVERKRSRRDRTGGSPGD